MQEEKLQRKWKKERLTFMFEHASASLEEISKKHDSKARTTLIEDWKALFVSRPLGNNSQI